MTYDYMCSDCNKTIEIEQSIKEPPLTACPECGSSSFKRLISGTGSFILSGSGWGKDSYTKDPYEADKKAASNSKFIK